MAWKNKSRKWNRPTQADMERYKKRNEEARKKKQSAYYARTRNSSFEHHHPNYSNFAPNGQRYQNYNGYGNWSYQHFDGLYGSPIYEEHPQHFEESQWSTTGQEYWSQHPHVYDPELSKQFQENVLKTKKIDLKNKKLARKIDAFLAQSDAVFMDQYEQRFNVFNNNYTDDKDSHGIANVRLADRIEFFCVQNLSNEAAYNGGPQLQEMTYKNWSTGYSDADLTAWQHSGYHSQQVNNHVDITQQTDSDEPNLDQFIMTSFPGDESTEPIVLTASEEADILTRLLPRCLLDDE